MENLQVLLKHCKKTGRLDDLNLLRTLIIGNASLTPG